MELLEDGGAAAGSSRMASRRLRLDIQVGGAAGRLCARGPGVFSEKGAGCLGKGRRHDSDGGRLGAGTDSVEGLARAACGAPNISSLARAGRRHGSRAAGEQVGRSRLGVSEGGRSRTHYLGWECRPAGQACAARGGAG